MRAALTRPHAPVDRTGDPHSNTNDSTANEQRDEDADDHPLRLGASGPAVSDRTETESASLAPCALVLQPGLLESLVRGPHGALLVVGADSDFIAEGVLFVLGGQAGVGGDVA